MSCGSNAFEGERSTFCFDWHLTRPGYHNPEFHAQMAQQKQSKAEMQQQKKSMAASYGQQRFQDLHKFTSFLRDTGGGVCAIEKHSLFLFK